MLREKMRLYDRSHVTVEEAFATLFHVLAHNLKYRVIKGFYISSTETFSRQFGMVLTTVLKLTNE